MAFMNFGLYQGLSAKIPYDQMMDRQTQLMAVRRQTRVDAENKAKLMGEDMKFATMFSDFQREKLNGFYSEHLKKMGDFVLKNPDMATNPVKMMQFNQYKQQMLDNPIVAADMRFKTESEALTKWAAETPDAANDHDFQKMLQQRDNYNKYGSTSLTEPGKDFVFINPDTKVNLLKDMQDQFGALGYDQIDVVLGSQEDGYTRKVSQQAIYSGAKAILSDPKRRRVIEKTFANLSEEEQKPFITGNGKPDYALWLADQGKSLVKSQEFKPPVNLKQTAAAKGAGGNDATATGGPIDYLNNTLAQATKQPGVWVKGNVNGVSGTLIDQNTKTANFSGAMLLTPSGNQFVNNPEQDNIPPLTESGQMALSNTTSKYISPTGEIMIDPSGHSWAQWKAKIPVAAFETMFPEYAGAVDHGNGWGTKTEIRRNDKKWIDTEGSTVFGITSDVDEKGEQHDYVTFKLQTPFIDNPKNVDYATNSAYNYNVGGIPKAAGINNQEIVTFIDTDGMYGPKGGTISGYLNQDGGFVRQ